MKVLIKKIKNSLPTPSKLSLLPTIKIKHLSTHSKAKNLLPSRDKKEENLKALKKDSSLKTLKVTPQNFHHIISQSKTPVLAVFSASWCGPCRQTSPIIDQVDKELKNKYTILNIDVDKFPSIISKYEIRGLPTLILFKNGKLISTKIGGGTKKDIVTWINEKEI